MRWSSAFPPAITAVFFTESAVVERINSGSDASSRTTIVAALKCSVPQWLDVQQKERAGLATTARALKVKSAIPSAAIRVRDRFIHNGTDYRIAAPPQPVPVTNPSHYLLYMEDES